LAKSLTSSAPLIVLLQGPVGPFFAELGMALQATNCRVMKINFNLGDVMFSGKLPAILYREGLEAWEAWLRQFLTGYTPAKVVLFGDQRPYHQVAVALCRSLGIEVWCLEEGYIRPDYVTIEPGGNNAASLLPRRLASFEADPPVIPLPVPIIHNGFRPMAWAAVKYFTALKAGGTVLRQYRHHRSRPTHTEVMCWLLNAYRKQRHLLRNSRLTLDLIDRFERRYFVVALQVHDDLQLRVHGGGWTMERVIEAAIRSFALHAPPQDKLVFKSHPLDRGHRPYHALVKQLATLAGVAERVVLIDDAPMGLLLRHARGVVTVNSTSALLALQRNCPVFVLGEAFFRVKGLVSYGDQNKLDTFWRLPFLPSNTITNAYISGLIANTQVNGSFYIARYFDLTARNIIERMGIGQSGQNARAAPAAARPAATKPSGAANDGMSATN
jgi:capsular polysaccharide export protein